MELQHVNVKIFVQGELAVDPARFIEIFHRWIQQQKLQELLIDVADYRHVPSGPSVLLIGHDADYGIDNVGNRYGLYYNRKAPLEGSNADRFGQALRSAANACRMLEEEFADGSLKFSRSEFQLLINDRALAPNTPETWEACQPEIEAFLKNVLGHEEFDLERDEEPRRRFGVIVSSLQPFDLNALCGAASG